MDRNNNYINILNKSLNIFFKDILRISITNPAQTFHFFKTVRWQKRAAHIRSKWAKEDIHVPPIIIFSITNQCNLQCKGCYAQALRHSKNDDLSDEQIKHIINEAYTLGVSFFVLAGGEPLIRKEILDITKQFPEIIFLIFTNGLLIDGTMLKRFKKQKNIIPVISLEGHEEETDGRRGQGVYRHLNEIVKKIQKQNIFYSVSLTVTSLNLSTITDDKFIQNLVGSGCKLFFFLEYTAIREGTEKWMLKEKEKEHLKNAIDSFRKNYSALFISVPDDEKQFGGCLSSGRGFVHISPGGDLEACPFAPFTDTNLKNSSLKDALQSNLLKVIRENSDQLEEGKSGCALWERREWVQSLLKK
jgi:MoaA/NifB/PqqE/SkfB family radical SAM enzyme